MMDEDAYIKEVEKRRKREQKEILSLEKGEEYRFPLREAPDPAALSALNQVFPAGLCFSLDHEDLVVTVREKNAKIQRTRNAGRKKTPKELSPDPSNPFDLLPEHVSGTATVHKVEALIRAVGSERAADLLHMSKTGMYKRLRTARAKNLPAGPMEKPYGEGDLKF